MYIVLRLYETTVVRPTAAVGCSKILLLIAHCSSGGGIGGGSDKPRP
jgi:hypothetical protein